MQRATTTTATAINNGLYFLKYLALLAVGEAADVA